MKFYFAGIIPSLIKPIKELGVNRVLQSYADKENALRLVRNGFEVFLDSGAYSVYTQGLKIDVKEYGKFLLEYGKEFKYYANLDAIKSAEETLANQEYLEGLGLKPIPTFHVGEDFNILKEMIGKYEFIALGGMVPWVRKKRILHKWLQNVFAIVQNKVKTHAFGIMGLKLPLAYPFYSSDSTSWIAGGRYGAVATFKGLKLKSYHYLDKQTLKDFKGRAYKLIDRPGVKSHEARCLQNLEVLLEVEKFVTKVWERRGVKWTTD